MSDTATVVLADCVRSRPFSTVAGNAMSFNVPVTPPVEQGVT